MQFDLARILEMLEERFGRPATTGFLALIAIAVAVFCLSTIWTLAIQPIYKLVADNFSLPTSQISLLAALYAGAYVAIIAGVIAAVYKMFSARGVPQSVIDRLAELRSEAISKILNGSVKNARQFTAWKAKNKEWSNSVHSVLEKHFPRAEVLGFEQLGLLTPMQFPKSFNNEHTFELIMFAKRLSILEDIIRRHTKT
ncbi:MAG: hypothetical protein K8F62_16385 [Pseudorhodoplanes sp.]|nr:hypothetical protein [Pseudorhodoplanes sp.]